MARNKRVASSVTTSALADRSESNAYNDDDATIIVASQESSQTISQEEMKSPNLKRDASFSPDSESEDTEGELEEDEYEVEEIIEHKTVKGQLLYHVKWKGYPSSDNTWEPPENLASAPEVLRSYRKLLRLDSESPKKANIKKDLVSPTRKTSESPVKAGIKRSASVAATEDNEEDEDSDAIWTPKGKNWADQIEEIVTVDYYGDNGLLFYVAFKNGKRKKILGTAMRKHAPTALLDFYEDHLNIS